MLITGDFLWIYKCSLTKAKHIFPNRAYWKNNTFLGLDMQKENICCIKSKKPVNIFPSNLQNKNIWLTINMSFLKCVFKIYHIEQNKTKN